jgi:hypothetical protein
MCYVSCLPKIMCCMTTVLFLNMFFFFQGVYRHQVLIYASEYVLLLFKHTRQDQFIVLHKDMQMQLDTTQIERYFLFQSKLFLYCD